MIFSILYGIEGAIVATRPHFVAKAMTGLMVLLRCIVLGPQVLVWILLLVKIVEHHRN